MKLSSLLMHVSKIKIKKKEPHTHQLSFSFQQSSYLALLLEAHFYKYSVDQKVSGDGRMEKACIVY